MFAYVSYWKIKGYQSVHLVIRARQELVFALLRSPVFSDFLHLIDILETNILSFPILNIVTVFLCIKSSVKNQCYLVVTVLC